MKKVVILGALSGIAIEIERLFAARGAALGLLDINAADIEALTHDLTVRGAAVVEAMTLDLAAPVSYDGTLRELSSRLGGIDVLIITYGILGNQGRAKDDLEHANAILTTDFVSASLWLLAAAKVVSPGGNIVVFSSVAGDRGRKSNFVYGAAKGGLAVFAQGLAHDLAETGPHVMIVKPGLVDTPMTADIKKGGPLWASAKNVARIVVREIDKKSRTVVYVPWFWRWIMLIIRLLPTSIFHRLNL